MGAGGDPTPGHPYDEPRRVIPWRVALQQCLPLAVTLLENLHLPSQKLFKRRNITDGAVQPNLVVMVHLLAHDPPGVIEAQGVLGRMHSRFND